MSSFTNSPLFTNASRAIQRQAREAFQHSDFGRLARQVRQIAGQPGHRQTEQNIGDLLRQHLQFSPARAVRQLMGADFGTLVREIHRYSQSSGGIGRRILGQFLESLGPAGSMIKALTESIGGGRRQGNAATRELTAAANMLRAFGFEVLPPRSGRGPTFGEVGRGVAAARDYLESLGYSIIPPGEQTAEQATGRYPAGYLPQRQGSVYHIDLPFGTTTRRFLLSHPIVTGDMVRASGSSNVWAFGYDFNNAYLYVRFANKGEDEQPIGPGPLYRYSGVTPDQFLTLYGAGSKGTWVWDNLRIRGTISGHQKDYELVGIMPTIEAPEGYVPRKATVEPMYQYQGADGWPLPRPRKVGNWEIFLQREVRTIGNRWVRSQLPTTTSLQPRGPGGPSRPTGPHGGW
jgi:hypothetical protein